VLLIEENQLDRSVSSKGLQRVKVETNIAQTMKRRKTNSIGKEDEKEDISYQMALMKRRDTGN
jgi:hypothetical protein